MLNRILLIVLVILFVLLGYFGMQQMQTANQLKESLAAETQQTEALKQSAVNCENAKIAAEKSVEDLTLAVQNLQKQHNETQASLAAQGTMVNKLTEENKTLQAKTLALQTQNKHLDSEKKLMESRFNAATQAAEARIKTLTNQVQSMEQPSGTGAAVVTPLPSTQKPAAPTAGIGAKL